MMPPPVLANALATFAKAARLGSDFPLAIAASL